MLFLKRFWPGIADGSITVTFRRWKRPIVVTGRRYRTPAGIIEVENVELIQPATITDHEAHQAGHHGADELRDDLPGAPDLPTYRIRFHLVEGPDPRSELANTEEISDGDLANITRRLERLDVASSYGPWTREVLSAIAAQPGRRAADLAQQFGRELLSFKRDVRKLKNLGLTLSLKVGYRLSLRGEAYQRRSGRL